MTDKEALDKKLAMSLDDIIKSDGGPGSRRPGRGGHSSSHRPRRDNRDDRRKENRDTRMRIADDRSRSRSRDVRMRGRDAGGVTLSSRTQTASSRRRSASPEGRRIIKVGNLPEGLSWRDLKDAFGGSGTVEHADVDGPVGFVKFKESAAAVKAIREYDGGNLNGNKIYVRYA